MELDVNINNKQKHWVLVIIDKCKNVLSAIFGIVRKCITVVGGFFKKSWKYILGVVLLIGLIVGGIVAYSYYTNIYLPEKKLDAAVEEIITNINSKNDSIKTEYALHVLDKKYKWGYEGVDDRVIYSRLSDYWEQSFNHIESKAYAGDPRCQYILGQIYLWGDKFYNYVRYSPEKSTYWLNEAAQQGYIRSYNNLGLAYYKGHGVKKDWRKAVDYLKKGAEAGDDWAQRNYGDMFVEGVKIKVGSHKVTKTTSDDYYGNHEIKKYYDSNRMKFITTYYEVVDDYEILIPKDIVRAKYWWKKAAAQGNKVAKERLQKIY